jgi:hypothetical protein
MNPFSSDPLTINIRFETEPMVYTNEPTDLDTTALIESGNNSKSPESTPVPNDVNIYTLMQDS